MTPSPIVHDMLLIVVDRSPGRKNPAISARAYASHLEGDGWKGVDRSRREALANASSSRDGHVHGRGKDDQVAVQSEIGLVEEFLHGCGVSACRR